MVYENLVAAGVTILALALTVIGAFAYRRSNDRALLAVTAAFALFFVKGIAMSVTLFSASPDLRTLFLLTGVFDLAVLALFYGFTLRR